ncbi:hypothetical protein MLD38_032973 [Melastoma candidum]|uniref:Uncharacterized protein n=1 Tax=Melastoma candidum TaxID=119954 RepID=A0ACB9M7J6_9MYRT|nr:hypothetical protein MLD38_032973 [Melastoma candidum]
MEELTGNNGAQLHGIGGAVRKKRSQTFRRRPDLQSHSEGQDTSPLSSAPPSEDVSKGSSDENNGGDSNSKRKEFNLNQCVIRVSSTAGSDSEKSRKKNQRDDVGFNDFYNTDPGRSGPSNKRSSEGVLAPANWKGASKAPDSHGGRNSEIQSSGPSGMPRDGLGLGNENKVKMVKLKVGGVTRTISTSNGGSESGSSAKNSRQSDSSRSRHKGSPDDVHSSDKWAGLQGIPWKDFSKAGFVFKKEDQLSGKMAGKSAPVKQEEKVEPVRKSKRVPKKRVMDGDFDEDEDEELRYLEKLKNSKMHMGFRADDEGPSKKQRKLASVSDLSAAKPAKDVKKKSRTDKGFEDIEYEEEEEIGSDREVEGKKKRQKKEFVDTLMDNSKREMTLTTRQRAMQSKEASASGASTIEFPNGLPPAPPRKQKEKLSEVEQQLKKAEAAQRRRIQNEKAARESEAEAIRKILGQDSNRKKREEKIKKRQEELAEEKAANESMRASNCIRWVMGPSGTVVTFPNDMGLPTFFNSGSSSYPPPRENCAGPSCTNPYKYRDSKTKLPLCSLHCYKAVQEKMQSEPIC